MTRPTSTVYASNVVPAPRDDLPEAIRRVLTTALTETARPDWSGQIVLTISVGQGGIAACSADVNRKIR